VHGVPEAARKPVPRDRFWQRRPGSAGGRLRAWLAAPGSLTRRIQARCPGFSVRLIAQQARRATREERFLGAWSASKRAVVREVCLCCGETPLVFAHSVVRRRDLRGPWRGLARLGSRPLGAALFADPLVRRGPLRFRRLSPRSELHARAQAALGAPLPPLWARRSVFVRRGSPILVTEVFLPGILAL
jgi:chorismate--pyruvate lyase